MHYVAVSFSHKNTDLSIREKLAFDEQAKEHSLRFLNDKAVINEAMIVSTCNRVEVYVSTPEPEEATKEIFDLLSHHSDLSRQELEGRADTFEDHGAVHHIFSVTSSLDSLVIGETQITGQVRDAYRFACDRGVATRKIGTLMDQAFRCAAAVRSTTDITKNPVSVASAAVAKAKEIVGQLQGLSAVVVGAGEMGTLAAKHLATAGAKVIVVNRSLDKAQQLADELPSGEAARLIELPRLLNEHPLVFTAISVDEPLITERHIEDVGFERFWFDLAVPRNIDTIKADDLSIFWVDDLRDIVAKNVTMREEQARAAYTVVGEYTIDFFKQLETRSLDPLIKALRSKAESACTKELERYLKKGYLPKEHEETILKLLHGAFNTFLHTPTLRLKDALHHPQGESVIDSVAYMFDLHDDDSQEKREV